MLAEHFENVRRGLDTALQAYNRAVGSFEARVLVTARKFKELGAGSDAELGPVEMIDRNPRQLSLAGMPSDEDETADTTAIAVAEPTSSPQAQADGADGSSPTQVPVNGEAPESPIDVTDGLGPRAARPLSAT